MDRNQRAQGRLARGTAASLPPRFTGPALLIALVPLICHGS